jgi:hypothetical protein
MKATDVQKTADTQAAILSAYARQQTKATILCWVSLLTIFVVPQFIPSPLSEAVMAISAAGLFTACLSLFPQSLRGRSGSLTVAYCLGAFLWLCAAAVIWFSLRNP